MTTLDAVGKELKDLTPVMTLSAGALTVALTGNASYPHLKVLFDSAETQALGKVIVPPAPAPAVPKLTTGVCGLCGRWENAPLSQQRQIEAQTGITHDRIDFRAGTEGASIAEEHAMFERFAATGAGILPIYDPIGLLTRSLTTVTEEVKAFAALCERLGISALEVGNETYYSGTAAQYGPVLGAVEAACAGTLVVPIANGWGDYYTGTAWSQCAGGKGWCVDLCNALDHVPQAWSMHFYGRESAGGVLGGGAPMGWDSLGPMQAYLVEHGLLKPLHITETGFKAPEEVSDQEQAEDLKSNLLQCSANPNIKSVYIFASKDGGSGEWGLYTSSMVAKPAVAAVAEAVKAIG
jgi:hypothetical protein